MYRFEWNYKKIIDEKSFNELVEDLANEVGGVNYEQGARLFYKGKNMTIMVELQIPTKDMIDLTEEKEMIWLDAYEVKDLNDYDCSNEIYTGIGNGEVITYDNAEQKMLELAKALDICMVR